MSRARFTKPGISDNHFISVICTPDRDIASFHEEQDEAEEAARVGLGPSVSVYVGQVLLQGEHGRKGTADHFAVVVELDRADRAAIKRHNGATKREGISDTLHAFLRSRLDTLRAGPADGAGDDDLTVCKPLVSALLASTGDGDTQDPPDQVVDRMIEAATGFPVAHKLSEAAREQRRRMRDAIAILRASS